MLLPISLAPLVLRLQCFGNSSLLSCINKTSVLDLQCDLHLTTFLFNYTTRFAQCVLTVPFVLRLLRAKRKRFDNFEFYGTSLSI